MNQIELLAPAGSLAALKAAVENGADAVYIGGDQFSARQKAENFTREQMEEGIRYAHDRGVKIHVALNTLINNDEMGNLIDYIYDLAEVGVDALIVQDLGVAHIIRETLPQMEVHASTQMAVHNTPGVKFLENQGYDRVVLARETSLATIKEIRKETEVDLEVFVHGALCVAYSGQCLLSSMIGGRSGNRGLCAQPCRMSYQLWDSQGQRYGKQEESYLLSTRDLNMIGQLGALVSAGVRSLKIEGRMKRPEYVATVVRYYRQAIDACYGQRRFDRKQADKDLLQIFNRSFTTGYYFANQGSQLMSHTRPDNRGVYVADVLKTERKKVWMQLKDSVSVGDGYLLYNRHGDEVAGVVRELSIKGKQIETAMPGQIVQLTVSGNADGADKLYRTADVQLLKEAADSFKQPSPVKKQTVHFKIELKEGAPISLLAWDDAGHQAYGESTYLVELAKNRPSSVDSVKNQLDRLGNTIFEAGDMVVDLQEGIIAPASELNHLRRTVIEELTVQVQQEQGDGEPLCSFDDYQDNVGDLLDRIPPQVMAYGLQQQLAVTVGSIEGVEAAIDGGATIIYLQTTPLRRQKKIVPEQYQALVQQCHDRQVALYWTCSPIQNNQQLVAIRQEMKAALEVGFDGILVGNLGLLQLAREVGWVNIVTDYMMNVFNDVTLQYLSEQEISRAVLSPELSLEQIGGFSYLGNLPLELVVHGNFPLMVSEQCVAGSVIGGRTAEQACSRPCMKEQYYLQDRTNARFPLYMDQNCRMHVYNSKTLSLYKRLADCLAVGADVLRIEAREQSAPWIAQVCRLYREAIDQYNQTGSLELQVEAVEQLDGLSPEGATYGHYFRGVL